MKALLLASVCVLLLSSPSLACRALWEYPETIAQLERSEIPAKQKQSYRQKLDEGWVIHEKGRAEQKRSLMRESTKMLDEIKALINKK